MQVEQGCNNDEGYRTQNIGYTLKNEVDSAAIVTFDGAVCDTDDEVDSGYGESKDE